MKQKRLFDVTGTILLFIGMLIAFSSHAFHAKLGLGEETSHVKHIVSGIFLVIIGLGILIYNNNALKSIKRFK
ncbi:hypothetical protein HYX04_03440 [Candidatus Woesearchaeota archaeon]|nr:hypothetical protein [Candidatus Woesearchaeota archaeon]